MRISDWSSDLCSSDLRADDQHGNAGRRSEQHRRDVIDAGKRPDAEEQGVDDHRRAHPEQHHAAQQRADKENLPAGAGMRQQHVPQRHRLAAFERPAFVIETRSEEHTSELTSLMRNSYAVFRMKKKTYNTYTSSNCSYLN